MDINDSKSVKTSKKQKLKSKWERRRARLQNVKRENDEMDEIKNRMMNMDPALITKFSDFPLSKRTQNGLKATGYVSPTEIQRQGIPVALEGHDVLGAAKTGSGKTLAFLIPVLECLWKLKWSSVEGLGALVISPTRELAYQTFEVLCKIGKHHDISAGLIIGGKEVSFEQQRIQKTNIIVCTPGRLLQHMDETPNFDCSTLKILVLDEADRILDMGFSETVNAIIENLPEERQTLLYSATQTSSVSDLARLSLHDPQYISAYKDSEVSTPQELKQSYVVCELQEKIRFLYSFIRNHLKNKILVFLSSCKQVKFTFEAYRRLRPGVPLMALYGKQHQVKRVATYNDFCRKKSAVLLATDIASRGLDFPAVHWVIQLDCPEDANTYIHRAGRTARYHRGGHSLLILLPSEEKGMLKELEKKKVPITEIKANPKKLNSIQTKLEALCVQDQNIKQWAQKSVVSYVRSVYLQSNKEIFNVDELPIDKYSISLGLLTAPRIRFLQKVKKKFGYVVNEQQPSASTSSPEEIWRTGPETTDADNDNNDNDNDFLVLRERNVDIPGSEDEDHSEKVSKDRIKTKISSAKKVLKKKIKVNSRVVFNDEGESIPCDLNKDVREDSLSYLLPVSLAEDGSSDTGVLDLEQSTLKMVKQDELDKREFQEIVKQKHREKRKKEKMKRKLTPEDDDEAAVTLKNPESEDEDTHTSSSYRSTSKRLKREKRSRPTSEDNEIAERTLEDDEELVLRLLEQ